MSDKVKQLEADCVVKDAALKNMVTMADGQFAPDHPFTIVNAEKTLSTNPGKPLLERMERMKSKLEEIQIEVEGLVDGTSDSNDIAKLANYIDRLTREGLS